MDLLKQFKTARLRHVPLIAWQTPDPAATIAMLGPVIGESAVIRWDIVSGMKGLNEAGRAALQSLFEDDTTVGNPVECMVRGKLLPPSTVLFAMNSHRFLTEISFVQAVWLLRDQYKDDTNRTLVLLGTQFKLPEELQHDVVVLDEPLPEEPALHSQAVDLLESNEIKVADDILKTAVHRGRGMSAFAWEQALAMSLEPDGIDLKALEQRQIQGLEQTPGIRFNRSKETFDDIGGLQEISEFVARNQGGPKPAQAVVWIDEIEKAMAGVGGDLSGTTDDMLGVLLNEMQENQWDGLIAFGVPGSGKSLLARAMGNSFKIPSIMLDLGATKGSLVGQSEGQIRQALKVIKAVANGAAYFVATCNSVHNLRPELIRRFTDDIWYFDLPTSDEKEAIWKISMSKFSLTDKKRPDDVGWTGSNVFNCCKRAWRQSISLIEAAKSVNPFARSNSKMLEDMRKQADGKYLSASSPGVFKMQVSTQEAGELYPSLGKGRQVKMS